MLIILFWLGLVTLAVWLVGLLFPVAQKHGQASLEPEADLYNPPISQSQSINMNKEDNL